MEAVVTIGIVALIAFIAGRALVGSSSVTKEYAQATCEKMYQRGCADGRDEGIKVGRSTTPVGMVKASAAQLLAYDEYLKGYFFAMKAVREYGINAEVMTQEHILAVVEARTKATLSYADTHA
jgi:hypothetical protein